MRIRDGRLYHKAFDTFEEYCQKRWGFTKSRANQLIESADVVQHLATIVVKPANEGQARALTKAPKESRAEVWQEAVESAPTCRHCEAA